MAWNEPGGGKDPWGSRRKSSASSPNNVVADWLRKLEGLFGGKGGGSGGNDAKAAGVGIGLIVAVALIVWLVSGFFIVQQAERGVVLRFGKLNRVVEVGVRWHVPYPFERVEKVNVEKVATIEIGYRSQLRTQTKLKEPKEALMLTEDENIVDVEFAVQYQVKNATDYLFNVQHPEDTIRQATESAVREVVGRSKMDDVLTEGRGQIDGSAQELLQAILDRYDSGIQILRVEMQRAQPPEEVKSAFDDVVRAREDEVRKKNEAEAYANDIIPKARGDAARLLQEAQGYKARVVSRAEGDARRFSQVAGEYVKAPGVTRERLYIETMEQVMSNTTKVMIDQKGGNNLIYLPLDKIIGARPETDAAPVAAALPGAAESEAAKTPTTSRARADVRKRGVQP